jgi:N-acyl homoserine lactone hydrolase
MLTGTMRQSPSFDARAVSRACTPLGWPFREANFIRVPVLAFAIEHPDGGLVLVDTGLHPSVADDPSRNLGRRSAFLMDVQMRPEQGVRNQLERRGIDPERISVIVMTHLHVDHASALIDFSHATLVVDRREWHFAISRSADPSYYRPQFDLPLDLRLVDYEGPTADAVEGFARAIDLFGDGSITLLSTPGHSAGHQSVLVRLAERDVLITGDAALTRRAIDAGTMPMHAHDEHRLRCALGEIRGWAADHPRAIVIPGHDAAVWRMLAPVYH